MSILALIPEQWASFLSRLMNSNTSFQEDLLHTFRHFFQEILGVLEFSSVYGKNIPKLLLEKNYQYSSHSGKCEVAPKWQLDFKG